MTKASSKPSAKAAKAGPGRPSDYTEKLAAEICDRLSTGETLASICRDPKMPAVRTVSDWKAAHEAFSADFACARDAGFDVIAEETLQIADDDSRDWEPIRDKDSGAIVGVKVDGEHVSRSKLRIETRLKLLAKWDPRRYGDKVALTDGDGGKLAPAVVVYQLPDNGRG